MKLILSLLFNFDDDSVMANKWITYLIKVVVYAVTTAATVLGFEAI